MNNSHNLTESTISSTSVYKGRLLSVYSDNVTLPDGSTSQREWIKHPGATAVIPLFENGDIMLIKQFRYPPRKTFIEVPAGKIDSGEDPLLTGLRELREETGLIAHKNTYIGSFYPCIGYSDEIIHIVLAEQLEQAQTQVDDDEFLIPFRLPLLNALEQIDNGIINDGKTIISLLRVSRFLERRQIK